MLMGVRLKVFHAISSSSSSIKFSQFDDMRIRVEPTDPHLSIQCPP